MKCCFTVDVDMTDYFDDRSIDEMEIVFPIFQKLLIDYPDLKTTWFVRIDSQMDSIYGRPDHVFSKHAGKLEWLAERGHQIGWHHHAYKRVEGRWEQIKDEGTVCSQLCRYGEVARKWGLSTTRMGWAFQTNATLQQLEETGFEIDSSAIPRPMYRWTPSGMDWTPNPPPPVGSSCAVWSAVAGVGAAAAVDGGAGASS